MKKFLNLTLLIFLLVLLVGCKQKKDLIIYTYLEGGDEKENVIELYNPTDEDIILDNKYSIHIYNNGSIEPKINIPLKGTIKKGNYFIIGSKETKNKELEKLINHDTKKLLFNGDDAVALHKDKNLLDLVGYIGEDIKFGVNNTLIRDNEKLIPQNKYNPILFMNFGYKRYDLLNKEIKNPDINKLLKGPQFNKEWLTKPFGDGSKLEDSKKGLGGAVEVTVNQYIDGDTTEFKDKDGNIYRTRYAFIDTPESTPKGGYQAWGEPAKQTANHILKSAKKIYLQSLDGVPIKDQYGRYWGIIWVDNLMLNFLMIKGGFTEYGLLDSYNEAYYEDIPYSTYFHAAYLNAINNKITFLGNQKDPIWDYKQNKPVNSGIYNPDYNFLIGEDE